MLHRAPRAAFLEEVCEWSCRQCFRQQEQPMQRPRDECVLVSEEAQVPDLCVLEV